MILKVIIDLYMSILQLQCSLSAPSTPYICHLHHAFQTLSVTLCLPLCCCTYSIFKNRNNKLLKSYAVVTSQLEQVYEVTRSQGHIWSQGHLVTNFGWSLWVSKRIVKGRHWVVCLQITLLTFGRCEVIGGRVYDYHLWLQNAQKVSRIMCKQIILMTARSCHMTITQLSQDCKIILQQSQAITQQ